MSYGEYISNIDDLRLRTWKFRVEMDHVASRLERRHHQKNSVGRRRRVFARWCLRPENVAVGQAESKVGGLSPVELEKLDGSAVNFRL